MPHIEQLAPHVAELIAAGEVVERPASIVKELLENAVDAGARAVTVEIRNGGMTYLRVSDDGCGIAPDELPTAFLRHATSKLRTADDLGAIGTLGFRGEALAAIAAVSRVDALTRVRGSENGASLRLEGGVAGEVQPAGCPEGTSFIVRDLFYNTPARLKFMKRDSAESAAISGLVGHIALSHPEISFRLLRDGEEVLHTPGDGVLSSAVYTVLGRDFARSLTEVRGSDGALGLSGGVTLPTAGHGTRAMQTFFVNARFVKSQLLTAALEQAYENRTMKGKFPGCVLNVTLPCDLVDVNVHPAKTVVKFVNEKAVFDLVYHVVSDALDAAGAAKTTEKPAAVPEAKSAAPQPAFYRTLTAAEFRAQSAAGAKPPVSAKAPAQAKSDASPAYAALFTAHGGKAKSPGRLRVSDSVKPAASPYESFRAQEKQPTARPEPEQTTLLPAAAPWRIAGEVLNTYIVCEDGEQNVWLIDKHAAHERLNFDCFRARQEPIMAQALLAPLVAQLSPAEYAALVGQLPLLAEFGFCCEEFGGESLLVREIPSELDESDAIPALEELAGKLLAMQSVDPAAARDALLHTMACRAAVKGGQRNDARELRVRVDAVQSGAVQFCPHGRPVKVKLSRYELEKMFGRA